MAATTPHNELEKIASNLVRWRTELKLTLCLAAIIGLVCVLGLIDLWLQLGRPDRFVTWFILVGLVGFTVWLVSRSLRKRYTDEGVAADIEKSFPELDNRLINYLQFARNPGNDPFAKAYVREGPPSWQTLDFRKMRDEKAHRRNWIFLGVATLALVLPALFAGQAWGIALWRTVNPFTNAAPLTLTSIVDVQPGETTVLQGDPLVLSCTVEGYRSHEVRVEVDPADADKTTYSIGRIVSTGKEEFSHRLPKVTTGLRYRFRAGDARPSAWFAVDTRPPPAFTALSMAIRPPDYTGRAPKTVDPRKDSVVVPAGSRIAVTATCNTPLKSATLQTSAPEPVAFSSRGDPLTWTGTAAVTTGSTVKLTAVDAYGAGFEEDIAFIFEPDRPPGIEIVAPGGRTILPPGELPQIEFRVSDDYGLTSVMIEEVKASGNEDKSGLPRKTWSLSGDDAFEKIWKSEIPGTRGSDIAFRIVAIDNRPGEPNRAVSLPIVFNSPSHSDAAEQRAALEQKAFAGLRQVIELQKRNIDQTGRQRQAMSGTEDALWAETMERQSKVRSLTRELLTNAIKPLGSLTPTVKKLYINEMVLAVDSLKAISTATPERKERHAADSLVMQEKILRQLTSAESAASRAKVDRRVSGLTAMLEALIRGQGRALKETRSFAESKAEVSVTLVDAQDFLAEDLSAFVKACSAEADEVRGNDAAFAGTLDAIARRTDELKIRNDMVIAAERLDENLPAEAIPLEERALSSLKALQAMLENMQLEQEKEKHEALVEAVAQAKEKLAKVKDLHTRMQEAMEAVRGTEDKNDEMTDYMEEAYEEMLANTKEALLEVPTDLHVFTDLNVANDLVEDVISVFQEVEQEEDSENKTAEDATEQAYTKEDIMLEAMEEAEGRLDDMETWLGDSPDDVKVTTEAFDREEMPESGIATGELPTAVEDLISDLLDEPEDLNEASDDSATTHAMPDLPTGWEVMEGDISSFAAKGKSGNQTPDHKEQDGRSNVGREGMSTGETAAGSGTISEGDKNIEERRTEDPTQSGQIDLDGEAQTAATGGGKLGTGKADDMGMSGGTERMDSNEEGSWAGMAALMARQADAIYAKASMKNVRVDSLKTAAHHLRQSGDAIAKGDIQQMREHRRMAAASLVRAKAELEAGPSGAIEVGASAGVLDDMVESGPDEAPAQFRDQVADYFKALNESL